MPKNDFLPFGLGAGADVSPQAAWETAVPRSTGFQTGTADSSQANKAWRQSAVISHVVAQWMMESTGSDILDNGNIEVLKARLKSAVFISANSQAIYDDLTLYKKVVEGLFAQVNSNIGRVDTGLSSATTRLGVVEGKLNGRCLAFTAYGSPGSYTHTFQPDGTWFIFELIGGGGAGGGAVNPGAGLCSVGSGGGGGGFTAGVYYARRNRIGPTIGITVGGAGTGRVGTWGGNGGTTALGQLAYAYGGGGGGTLGPTNLACGSNGGAAGLGSAYGENGFGGAVIVNQGNCGDSGLILGPGAALGGSGAPGPFGGGANAVGQGNAGQNSASSGGGGGGACLLPGQGPSQGGSGGNGLVRIWEYA